MSKGQSSKTMPKGQGQWTVRGRGRGGTRSKMQGELPRCKGNGKGARARGKRARCKGQGHSATGKVQGARARGRVQRQGPRGKGKW